MPKTYKPQGNRLLIQKIKLKEKTQGGIILPTDQAKHQHELDTVATIVLIGSKVDITLGLEIGQKIKYAKHSQTNLEEDGDLMLVKDLDIQAIIYESEGK